PSETFHQQNEKGRIIVNWKSRVKLPDSNKPVSGITGAVHLVEFYSAPEQFNDQEVHKLLVNFLVHVPNHVAAAATLLADFPVSDIFQVGAVRNDEQT
ncbi:hypothetical protein, partial [Vreelandella neptunia]